MFDTLKHALRNDCTCNAMVFERDFPDEFTEFTFSTPVPAPDISHFHAAAREAFEQRVPAALTLVIRAYNDPSFISGWGGSNPPRRMSWGQWRRFAGGEGAEMIREWLEQQVAVWAARAQEVYDDVMIAEADTFAKRAEHARIMQISPAEADTWLRDHGRETGHYGRTLRRRARQEARAAIKAERAAQ